MMLIKYCNVLLVCIVLISTSCSKSNIEISRFVGTTIIKPDSSTKSIIFKKGKGLCDTLLSFDENRITVVSYFNSQGCTSCKLKELDMWKKHMADSTKNLRVKYVFVFGSKLNTLSEVEIKLKQYQFEYPVIIDQNQSFEQKNKLPKNLTYHTFLLDKNNKVILVGSPIQNDKMWQLYKKTINTLNANNGILPQLR